jgi:hypothetical protein
MNNARFGTQAASHARIAPGVLTLKDSVAS